MIGAKESTEDGDLFRLRARQVVEELPVNSEGRLQDLLEITGVRMLT